MSLRLFLTLIVFCRTLTDGTPDIRARILQIYEALPEAKRTGPVILSEKTGRPYTIYGWSQAWRRFRKSAGINPDIQMRDIRAGAAAHAVEAGASTVSLRNAMQHRNVTTTDRYTRGRSKSINEVVALRRVRD